MATIAIVGGQPRATPIEIFTTRPRATPTTTAPERLSAAPTKTARQPEAPIAAVLTPPRTEQPALLETTQLVLPRRDVARNAMARIAMTRIVNPPCERTEQVHQLLPAGSHSSS